MPAVSEKQRMMIYLSGFFDGEGSISIVFCNDNCYRLLIGITNKDKIVLEWIRTIYGGFINKKHRYSDKHADAYEWRLSNRKEILKFLLDIEPDCKIKIKQIRLALEFLKLPKIRKIGKWPIFKSLPVDKKIREQYRVNMGNLNKRGVSYATN